MYCVIYYNLRHSFVPYRNSKSSSCYWCRCQNAENRVDVAEGETVRLRLQRSVYTSGSVTVQWTTLAHQAGALTDYSPIRGSVRFTAGQHTADISLAISDDQDEENLEVSSHDSDHVFLYLALYKIFIIIYYCIIHYFLFLILPYVVHPGKGSLNCGCYQIFIILCEVFSICFDKCPK